MSRRSTAFAKLFADDNKQKTVAEKFVKKEEPPPTMEYGMVPRDFAEAVKACREGRMNYTEKMVLQTRYGTEGFFFTAVEDIYVINNWEFSRNDKAAFRALFRSRAPIRA